MRWFDEVQEADRQARAEATGASLGEMRRLAEAAPTDLDRAQARLRRARALEEQGRYAEALRGYDEVAEGAHRRIERSRARHEQARLMADLGFVEAARRVSRRIVTTYPDLMPGLRALHRLERFARAEGAEAEDDHLAWSRSVYDRLKHTDLGDNLLYFAARVAYERWREGGADRLADRAEGLYLRLHREHYRDAMWEQAVWDLSWLYQRQERWSDMLDVIDRLLLTTRESSLFIGSYESRFFWIGALRAARVELLVLERPAAAAERFAWFVGEYETNRYRDDALFWEGCAWLRAGRTDRAEAAFARIPEVYEHSKYLRRLEGARANPVGPVCDPEPFEEEAW